jgi:hypothetical protein
VDLAREAKSVPWRSKDRATMYSLIPGLGQMYVGESRRGWARLGIAAVALAAVAVPAYAATQRADNLAWRDDWPLLLTGLAGLVTLSFDYTSSYEDAMSGVVLWNERMEAQFNRAHPAAP